MSHSSASIEILEHVSPIGAHRAAWLVDIWGVMHNGVHPFQGAVTACQTFRDRGGHVILVSNAPRPHHSVAQQLDRIGVERDAYDMIISSGDASKKMIQDLGACPVFHLGPTRDITLYDGCLATRSEAEAADAIVCTGLFDDETETPDDYADLLTRFVARGLKMICVNPDLQVERGGKLVYCAGALARRYQDLGGTVHYAGKPYPPIYAMVRDALAELRGGPVPDDALLAIGDGVHTDIEGASRAGIQSIYVASRVHVSDGKLTQDALAALFANKDFPPPIAAMTELVW